MENEIGLQIAIAIGGIVGTCLLFYIGKAFQGLGFFVLAILAILAIQISGQKMKDLGFVEAPTAIHVAELPSHPPGWLTFFKKNEYISDERYFLFVFLLFCSFLPFAKVGI